MKALNPIILILLVSALYFDAFNKSNMPVNAQSSFGIFTVVDDQTVVMDGDILSSSLANFNRLLSQYPYINTIKIRNCGGSADDEINLQLAATIHQKGINTHLMSGGEIASGGVDLFLAGVQRSKGSNTRIGVHSWAGDDETATDFHVGHANHVPYIQYYVSIGFSQQQAEAFYYFTINSAPAESIHWMTDAELYQFNLITR